MQLLNVEMEIEFRILLKSFKIYVRNKRKNAIDQKKTINRNR